MADIYGTDDINLYNSIDIIDYNNIRRAINICKLKITFFKIQLAQLKSTYTMIKFTIGIALDLTVFEQKITAFFAYMDQQIKYYEGFLEVLERCCGRYRTAQEQAIQEGILVGSLRILELSVENHQANLYL